ncbi:MAG: hypothetical protein CM15mP32_5170 [Flavobacteriaceae bacterium]|nr:MAG: hypothetical protein CM15mP32_5170 [Flavobacteriaceae bacterium]
MEALELAKKLEAYQISGLKSLYLQSFMNNTES